MKARHLYKTLAYPLNADFKAVLQVGGIGGCTVTVDDAKVAHKIWGASVPNLKGGTVRETGQHNLRVWLKSLGSYYSSSRRCVLVLTFSLSMCISSL